MRKSQQGRDQSGRSEPHHEPGAPQGTLERRLVDAVGEPKDR